jgi:hypothetical protein
MLAWLVRVGGRRATSVLGRTRKDEQSRAADNVAEKVDAAGAGTKVDK